MKKFTLKSSLVVLILFLGFIFLDKSFVNKALAAPTEKVILIGGMNMNGGAPNYLTDVWESSDLMTNTWSMLTNTPAWATIPSVGMPKAVFFDNKIWVVLPDTSNVTSSISYTSDGINWTNQTNLPFAFRVQETFLVFDDNTGGGEAMWILGGAGVGGQYNDVWKSYDGINWTQVIVNAPWKKRGEHTSVVFNNKMWVIGGNSNSATYEKDVWSSTNGINWTLETANGPWGPRTLHSSLVYGGKIWIFGGRIGIAGSILNFDTWSSPDGINWSLVSTNVPFTSERNALASVVYDNKMWLIGGHNDVSGANHNDVYSSIDGINWTASSPVSGPFSKRFNHQLLVVPINFGNNCQVAVSPIALSPANFVFGNNIINKFEITTCNEDLILRKAQFLTNQSSSEFRLESLNILDVMSGTMSLVTDQTMSDFTFKPSFAIPANSVVEFEVHSIIYGDPVTVIPGDTLDTQLNYLEVIIPSTNQTINFSSVPLPVQYLTY